MKNLDRRELLAALPLAAVVSQSGTGAGTSTSRTAPAAATTKDQAGRATTMTARPIDPTDGTYSEAMEIAGFKRLVFVSGQIPVDANDRVPATFREQARVAWANVAARLAKSGMTVKNIVKMTIFLSDRRYRGEAYQVRREVLGDHNPAMTIIICGIYDESWLLEIEAIAAD